MDIEIIRQRIRHDQYLIKSHAVVHALKEGFDRKHMVEAVLGGTVIEDYIDDQRAVDTVRELIEPARHARERRSMPTEYIVSTG